MALQEKYMKDEKGKVIYCYSNISKMNFWEYIWYYPFCLDPEWRFRERFNDMLASLIFLLVLILFPVTYLITIILGISRDMKHSKRVMELEDLYHDEYYKNTPREH